MKKGDQAHVTAHGISAEGAGIADFAGRTVACSGLFPGEAALVRVEAVSRQHPRAFARLEHVERAHPARRSAPCPRHERMPGGRCSGCALMELSEDAQREEKRAYLARSVGLNVARVETDGVGVGYRWSSKRVALGRRGGLLLGSYARASRTPARMTGCPVEHPLLREAFDSLERRACEHAIAPFDARDGQGDLRYVWGKTDGQRVILTLVTAQTASLAVERLAVLEGPVVGVHHSVHAALDNNMRGNEPRCVVGREELSTSLLGHVVSLGALGFLQPNPKVAELAYRALVEPGELSGATLALDLYAGAGVTTASLRQRFARVIPCEAYPESAAALGIAPRDVAEFLEEAVREGMQPDLIVANPPRKGLGTRVCSALTTLAVPELRIMSCGPEGLSRDLSELSVRYQLISLRAFDTLPQTPHVELVARLARRPTT